MSNTQAAPAADKAANAAETEAKIAKGAKVAELNDNDLDQVSGGLNPQPLPPRIAHEG